VAYYKDGLKVPNHIWEAAAMHRQIVVACCVTRCFNRGVFDPHQLWWLFQRKGWDDDFRSARFRFWCRKCSEIAGHKVKQARIELTSAEIVTHSLPWPQGADWKNFLSRHRG